MNKGIIILCMRKPQYACAAFNLALSIKHYTQNIHITLLSDGIHNKALRPEHLGFFNEVKLIKEDSVCEAKISVGDYVNYKQALFIDADSICVADLTPLFDKLKGSFKSNVIDGYTNWTSVENFRKYFKTEPHQTINSSWFYFENNKVLNQAKMYYKRGFDRLNLSEKWGGHLPDEMFLNAALSKLEMDARIDFNLMFFDEKKNVPISRITENYYFATFYGNRKNSRVDLQEWYDKMMFKICSSIGIEHRFKLGEILAHKLVNEK